MWLLVAALALIVACIGAALARFLPTVFVAVTACSMWMVAVGFFFGVQTVIEFTGHLPWPARAAPQLFGLDVCRRFLPAEDEREAGQYWIVEGADGQNGMYVRRAEPMGDLVLSYAETSCR